MTESHIDVVLRSYAAFNRGDWEAATSEMHPEFAWINNRETAGLMGWEIELHGAEATRTWWASFFGDWEQWNMDPGEPREGSRGRVFVPCTFSGRGPGSGVPVAQEFFQVWEFRGGLATRVTNLREREDALAGAGLA